MPFRLLRYPPWPVVLSIATRLLMLLVFLALVACQERRQEQPLRDRVGSIVSNDPLVVVPDRAWRSDPEQGLWSFNQAAGFTCYVTEAGFDTLRIQLQPAPADARAWRVRWDRTVVDDAVSVVDGVLFLSIPADLLSHGAHHLVLEPPVEATVETLEGPLPFVWRELGYDYAGSFRPFLADQRLRYRFFADFLLHGVTSSSGHEKLGGILFDGPQRLTTPLPSATKHVTARIQNASFGGATFRVLFDGQEAARFWLAPHAHHALEVVAPKGARAVTLSTVGEREGLFLWGAPRLVTKRTAALGPPIVLITLDTTRKDHISAYGAAPSWTPAIHRFVRGATVFERAFSTAPWTLPAHASAFTGLYPSEHQAGLGDRWLDPTHATLAERLRDRGYLTAGFVGGLLSTYRYGLAQGFDLYVGPEGLEWPGDDLVAHTQSTMGAYVDMPFFLFVNLFDPHFPFNPRGQAPDPSSNPAARSAWQALLAGSSSAWARLVRGDLAAHEDGVASLRRSYQSEITATDAQVGRLLDALRYAGRYDDALIIVTADHGELLGEQGFFSHGSRLDPELVEIPLIVKWPHQTTAQRVNDVVSLVDLFPTVLHAAGAEVPDQRGVLLQSSNGGPAARRPWVRFEEHESPLHPLVPTMKLGDHMIGLQGPSLRRVRWDRDEACHRRADGPWRPIHCPPFEGGTEVWSTLDQAEPAAGGVSPEERSQLRALGYMP